MFQLFFNKQFLKFVLVGVINTLFGYGIFSLLIFFKFHYMFAMLIATCLGILFNFKTIGSLVFASSNNKLLSKFFMVYIICYLINITIIKIMLLLESNLYLDGAIATLITAFVSYVLNKKYVFETNKLSPSG